MAGSASAWKGGLKKRAREDCDAVDTDGAASRTCTEKVMWAGGAKQRHASRSSASASQAASSRSTLAAVVEPSGKEFADHVARLFLMNKFSGPETVELVVKAHAAGAQGVRAMRKAGAQGKHPQNAKRDLMRTLLTGSSLWVDVQTHGGQVCSVA